MNTPYFLRTSLECNNDCLYCHHLSKKSDKNKSLKDIVRELKDVKKRKFKSIKLSCNTDSRKDFIKILQLIKENNFNVVLETNGRRFCNRNFLKKADIYINQYELYLSFSNKGLYKDITGDETGYQQSIIGVNNMSKFCKDKKSVIAKIVLLGQNSPFLTFIIDKIKKLRIHQAKFIVPFKLHTDDCMLSLAEVVSNITMIKNYAEEQGIKILIDQNLEYNPYLPQDSAFFDTVDTEKAELKIDFKKYKEKPYFSVVIPAFNKKEGLKFVLNNFFKQDYPKSKYEIIVIDDGSNDKTLQSIKKIKPSCNFKYFYWPRKRIASGGNFKKWAKFYNRAGLARNIGINHARGEIILFNDADILVTGDCLKKHEIYHNKYSNIIVRGFRMFLPEKFTPNFKKIEKPSFLDKISRPEKTERGKRLHCRMHNLSKEGWHRVITSNLSVKKQYLDRVGGFNKDFVFWGFEDVDLGYRLSELRMKLIWDEKIKVYHLYHPRESGDALTTLLTFWLGTNILYRKYLDEKIFNIFNDVILRRLDDLIFS